jgi:hypothetical protein
MNVLVKSIVGAAIVLTSLSGFAQSRESAFEVVPYPERFDRAGWVLQKIRAGDVTCDSTHTRELQRAISSADQTYYDRWSMFVFVANDILEPGLKRIVTDVILSADRTEITSIISTAQELRVIYSGPADHPMSETAYVPVRTLTTCGN